MKRIALFLPLVLFGVLAFFLWRGLSLDPNAMPSALLDKPFPAFSLTTLETGKLATEKDLKDRKLLVNIWATWCVTCRVEHPFITQLANKGVTVIGVNYKDKTTDAQQWLKEKGNPFLFNLADTDGKLGIDLGVFGAPETYFVDSNGIIRYKYVGELNLRVWEDTLQPVWESLH